MQSRTYKGAFGWKAEAVVNLTDTIRLCIVTMKRSSGALITSVTGSKREGDYYFYTVLQDFNKSVLASTPARVTQKTVEQQQAQAEKILDAIIDDARNFYKLVAA
jgi:predicted amino acid dehydrogenase